MRSLVERALSASGGASERPDDARRSEQIEVGVPDEAVSRAAEELRDIPRANVFLHAWIFARDGLKVADGRSTGRHVAGNARHKRRDDIAPADPAVLRSVLSRP